MASRVPRTISFPLRAMVTTSPVRSTSYIRTGRLQSSSHSAGLCRMLWRPSIPSIFLKTLDLPRKMPQAYLRQSRQRSVKTLLRSVNVRPICISSNRWRSASSPTRRQGSPRFFTRDASWMRSEGPYSPVEIELPFIPVNSWPTTYAQVDGSRQFSWNQAL